MREMKDSGVAWIGAMPWAWKMNTIAQVFLQVKCKNTGLQEKNLLSLRYGKVKRKSIDTVEGLLPESFDGYNIIEKDDIVLRLTDLQNDHTSLRVGLAEERGIITSAYFIIPVISRIFNAFHHLQGNIGIQWRMHFFRMSNIVSGYMLFLAASVIVNLDSILAGSERHF